jgi:hypothetical protein
MLIMIEMIETTSRCDNIYFIFKTYYCIAIKIIWKYLFFSRLNDGQIHKGASH